MRCIILCSSIMWLACCGTAHADDLSDAGAGKQTAIGCGPTLTADSSQPSSAESHALGGGILFEEPVRTGFLGRALDQALDTTDRATCARKRFNSEGWDTAHALATARSHTRQDAGVTNSSLVTGDVLGRPAAEAVQNVLHRLMNSAHPAGGPHQISAGGEPTPRNDFARQTFLGEFGEGTWHGEAQWKRLRETRAGIELRASSGWAVQYLPRGESPELRPAIGSRSLLSGVVAVSKSFF
jgi:hypothetical protein